MTVDLDLELALPTRVEPHALGKLPDGRWFLLAALFEKSSSERSRLAPAAWLVGPKP